MARPTFDDIRQLEVSAFLYGVSTEGMVLDLLRYANGYRRLRNQICADRETAEDVLETALAAMDVHGPDVRHPDEMAFVVLLRMFDQMDRDLLVRMVRAVLDRPRRVFPWTHRFAKYLETHRNLTLKESDMQKERREWIESLETGDEIKLIKEVHTRYQDNPVPGDILHLSKVGDVSEKDDGTVSRRVLAYWEGYEDGADFDLATHADPVDPKHPGTYAGAERSRWLDSLGEEDPVWQVNKREGERYARRVRRVTESTITTDLFGSAHVRQTGECWDWLVLEPVDDRAEWEQEWAREVRTQMLKNVKWDELTDPQRNAVLELLDGFEGVELDAGLG